MLTSRYLSSIGYESLYNLSFYQCTASPTLTVRQGPQSARRQFLVEPRLVRWSHLVRSHVLQDSSVMFGIPAKLVIISVDHANNRSDVL